MPARKCPEATPGASSLLAWVRGFGIHHDWALFAGSYGFRPERWVETGGGRRRRL